VLCFGFFLVGHNEFGSLLITDCTIAVNDYRQELSVPSIGFLLNENIFIHFIYIKDKFIGAGGVAVVETVLIRQETLGAIPNTKIF
jgi:hypothetical protein